MKLADYEYIQWYLYLLFWLLEFTIIVFVIGKRKNFGSFLFICFLVECISWFTDTQLILFNGYESLPRPFFHTLQIITIFYSNFLFFLVLFYYFILNKKVKKWIIPLAIIGTIGGLLMMYYNIHHGIYFTHYISIIHYVIILSLSIYGIFEMNPSDQQFKWNLSPSYLFYCGIIIQFLGNTTYDLFAPRLMYGEENLLCIIMTIHLFIWILFCLFFIAGLYQLGRNNKS